MNIWMRILNDLGTFSASVKAELVMTQDRQKKNTKHNRVLEVRRFPFLNYELDNNTTFLQNKVAVHTSKLIIGCTKKTIKAWSRLLCFLLKSNRISMGKRVIILQQ